VLVVRRLAAAPGPTRGGQALIEFAIIAFVLTFLLGAIITLGFMLLSANVLQQAADVAAQELARTPASPIARFDETLSDPELGGRLYRENLLIVPPGTNPAELPLVNRLLYPLYIYDPDRNVNRYPGTVVDGPSGLTVIIAITGDRDPETGAETIKEWRKVVEEVLPPDPPDATEGPYSLASPTPGELDRGFVALRINAPFQSGALVSYIQKNADGEIVPPEQALSSDTVTNLPVTADDSAVSGSSEARFPNGQTLAEAGYSLSPLPADPRFGGHAHRGEYGLGELQAFSTTVRPYRRVLSAQGVYRREVFGESP
jgi:hypothetical protein